MARTQTMVQLTDELLRALDAEAAGSGISRSALIREVLHNHLEADQEALQGRAIVEGYRRIPPGTPDEWADLETLQDISTRETLQRLDAEERAAGCEPCSSRGGLVVRASRCQAQAVPRPHAL